MLLGQCAFEVGVTSRIGRVGYQIISENEMHSLLVAIGLTHVNVKRSRPLGGLAEEVQVREFRVWPKQISESLQRNPVLVDLL